MKLLRLLVIACLAISSHAYERPYDLEGTYSFHGELRAVEVYTLTRVSIATRNGRKKLRALKKSGHKCGHKINFNYFCQKLDKEMNVPTELIEEVVKTYENYKVVFNAPYNEPRLEFSDKTLTRFQMQQTVVVNRVPFYKYRYEITEDMHRIFPSINAHGFNFVARSPEQLELQHKKILHTSYNEKKKFVFFIGLDRD